MCERAVRVGWRTKTANGLVFLAAQGACSGSDPVGPSASGTHGTSTTERTTGSDPSDPTDEPDPKTTGDITGDPGTTSDPDTEGTTDTSGRVDTTGDAESTGAPEPCHNNVVLMGYWPPTNEMLRPWSTNPEQNPDGWTGENWRGTGYDVYAFFPEFPPDGDPSNDGIGELGAVGSAESDLRVD